MYARGVISTPCIRMCVSISMPFFFFLHILTPSLFKICVSDIAYHIHIQALIAVGGIPGSLLGGLSSSYIGRRASLLGSGFVNTIGWLLIFLSQYTETSTGFKALLQLGRFLTGVGSGALVTIIPVSVSFSCLNDYVLFVVHMYIQF